MKLLDLLVIHHAARSSWPWLPWAAPAGSVWISDTGEAVRVLAGGGAAPCTGRGA